MKDQFDLNVSFPGTPIRPPKSTLISIVPWEIREFKPGLIPGYFHIPAAKDNEPSTLVVGDAIHYVYIDHDRGSMRVTNPSYVVARSIVADYNSAQMEANTGCHPGLFFEVGEFTTEEIQERFQEKLELANEIQNRWFEQLVRVADDDWEKTRQHVSISDFQRVAARKLDPLNKRNRPWIMTPMKEEPQGLQMTLCPSCGSDIIMTAAVCRYCQCIVDPEKYERLQFAGNAGKSKSVVEQAMQQANRF